MNELTIPSRVDNDVVIEILKEKKGKRGWNDETKDEAMMTNWSATYPLNILRLHNVNSNEITTDRCLIMSSP